MAGVITALHHDPEFAEAFRTRVIAPKLEVSRAVYERARLRGEIAADVDLDLIFPALAGIILHRSFVLGLPADEKTVARVVDEIILPAATRRSPTDPDPPDRPEVGLSMTTTTPAAVEPDSAHGHRHLGWALVLISVAQLMVVLDATIANIALPYIKKDLDISQANLSWVVTGYSLAFGGLLLLGGRLGDLYGRRRVFMVGVSLFAVASLLGGLATNEALLLGARGLQGVGAALASPAALALITTTFPAGTQRNRAFAVYAAMSGAGAAVGLILGGWLTGLEPTLLRPRRRRLAADLPHQRADRPGGRDGRPPAAGGERVAPRRARPARRAHRHPRPGRHRLRPDPRRQPRLRLGRHLDRGLAGRRRAPAGHLRGRSSGASPTRCCRSGSSPTAPARPASSTMMLVPAAMFAMFYFLSQFVQNVMGYSRSGPVSRSCPSAPASSWPRSSPPS